MSSLINNLDLYNAAQDREETIQEIFKDREQVALEGRLRQIMGDILDTVTMKEFRDHLRIGGWTGWNANRVKKGINRIESNVTDYLEEMITLHKLEGEVSEKAMKSISAMKWSRQTAIFLISSSGKDKLMESIVDPEAKLPKGDFFADTRAYIMKEVKTYDDFAPFFKKVCETSHEILDAIVEQNEGKLPKKILSKQQVIIDGLVTLATQLRGILRLAVDDSKEEE